MAKRAITFNPKNIDGSMYVDSTIQVQSDTINNVSNQLNTISTIPTTAYKPPYPLTSFSTPMNFQINYIYYSSYYHFSDATNVFDVFCNFPCSENQGLVSLSTYDTFGGFDTSPNHVCILDLTHATVTQIIGQMPNDYASSYASYLNFEKYLIYGVNFTYFFQDKIKFDGVKLYFPTSNTPVWIFVATSNDVMTWCYDSYIPPLHYTGSGNEIYTWNFPITSNFNHYNYYRLIVASASNTYFDFGGAQWFELQSISIGSALGIGNALAPLNLTGTSLLMNNQPFPILPLIILSDEVTDIPINTILYQRKTQIRFRCPFTFRITQNKMPVFSLSKPPIINEFINLDIEINGHSIYGNIYSGNTQPRIVYGDNDNTGTYASSIGTLSAPSVYFNEGDFITAYVSGTSLTCTMRGLKLTIYNS
jgi:hypothetical protein